MPKTIGWLMTLALLCIAVILGFIGSLKLRASALPAFVTPYHMVLLSNGQIFFGRIENVQSEHPILRDVFYIQHRADPNTKQSTNVLVKRGREWHAPDYMMLNEKHIVLVEPVTENSQVAKLIAEQNQRR